MLWVSDADRLLKASGAGGVLVESVAGGMLKGKNAWQSGCRRFFRGRDAGWSWK